MMGRMTTDSWAEGLSRLYADLDRETASQNHVCRGCGGCCHFDVVDHVLYVSEMERRYLALVSPDFPAEPDASEELLRGGLRCPYQSGGRCFAREGRPLGCRLHFCEGPELDYEAWHNRLKALHDEVDFGWDYRPLLPLA